MAQSALDSRSGSETGLNEAPVWLIELSPAAGCVDRVAKEIAGEAADLQLAARLDIRSSRGFLVQGAIDERQAREMAVKLFAEPVVEVIAVRLVSEDRDSSLKNSAIQVTVTPRPGVTDPQAETALRELRSLGYPVSALRTCRIFAVSGIAEDDLRAIAPKLLGNEAIEQFLYGPLHVPTLQYHGSSRFQLITVGLLNLDDKGLMEVSRQGGLSLTLPEMQAIQQFFRNAGRDPTDIELETIAQTWSEHCSHKTLAGKIDYEDEKGTRKFNNMLRETIFAATVRIREELGENDWCVSVFKDNAGVVDFDGTHCLTFKVETHNRPSAIEPYGGANTGIGGVIRDTLGTGLGARPICNTDVFCFAPPDTPADSLPPGVLHPRRIMKSVVAGVRDYGNRMGIPTVNGAVCFDPRYVGNPLVFCGNVGIMPRESVQKQPQPGDLIFVIGGRTGRDGIHGATFSSAELTEHSETTSGGAVQIGNAITEKMVLDVLLQARDRKLYHSVTDCGAGGFSSAVGEMGESTGAVVWLERAPLKYEGLSYTEIWISEAQERMVLAVPPVNADAFRELCESESVEATVIGQFEATGELHLTYEGHTVGRLPMHFLHDGRPEISRKGIWKPPARDDGQPASALKEIVDSRETLLKILGSGNVASKHWIIRQYDHEVLAGSVIKPLVGVLSDGPSDAAVVRPVLSGNRGVAISCGLNPHYGDLDPWHMAMSAIDEAVRNCVAVGANPERIAILDNFCWGYTDRPETLGALVRAALACHDLAIELKTPFISGKDSLNNEFSFTDASGQRRTISIPSTLLISAMGQVDDIRRCVTMDLKQSGNRLFLVGATADELGGSHFNLVNGVTGGQVPVVDGLLARRTFAAIHRAITEGLVRACHDLSEGGLAVAVAEMGFAGGLGAEIELDRVPMRRGLPETVPSRLGQVRLFAESNTRFVCEIPQGAVAGFRKCLEGIPCEDIGQVCGHNRVAFRDSGSVVLQAGLEELKAAWLRPFDWS
jgi:phosphoribosylformylglycinamidine synthase subunit PurSL